MADKGHGRPDFTVLPPVPDAPRGGRQAARKIGGQAAVAQAVALRGFFTDQVVQRVPAAPGDLHARAPGSSQPPGPFALQPGTQRLGRWAQVPDGMTAAGQQRHQAEPRHRVFRRCHRWPAGQRPQHTPLGAGSHGLQPDRPPVDQAQTVPVQHLRHGNLAAIVRHPGAAQPRSLGQGHLPVVPALLQGYGPTLIQPPSPIAAVQIIPENPHDPVKTCES